MTENTWVRTWGVSPQAPDAAVALLDAFADATLRQEVRISGGGRQVRIRFTNEYGTAPLSIGAARVAIAAPGGGIQPGTDRVLTFGGRPTADVPPGAPILTDPLDLPLPSLTRLSISLYVSGRVESCTGHGLPVQAGWMIPGDAVASVTRPAGAVSMPVRALLCAVEVLTDGPAKAVVAIGDSRTDGFGSAPDADRSWPDVLAERLAERGGATLYVSNQGISGNRNLNDGIGVCAVARFDRDVLATPGLGYVIVAGGINDLAVSFAPRGAGPLDQFLKSFPGAPVTVQDVVAGYLQLIARAHVRGVKVYATTLAPAEGNELFTPGFEAAREAVNAWIRTSGAFDAVLDFDAVWRDPAHPSRIREDLHSGDFTHGNDLGYRAWADSIDLSLFS